MTGDSNESPAGRSLTVVMVGLLVLSPAALSLGVGLVGTATAADGIHYVTDSGFEVEDTSGGAAPTSGNPFPNSETLDLPGINLSASGNAYVTLVQRNGTFSNLSSVDDAHSITVTPEDKQEVALMGGFDALNFSDGNYAAANTDVDIEYSASTNAALRLESTGLSAGETVTAVDVDTDATLDTATVATNGSVTFSALPSGDHVVNFETEAPSISSFSASNPSNQDVRVSFDSDKQLSTIDVTISTAESANLATDDFSETDNGGGYTYEATYTGSSDGTYDVSLATAKDSNGNDGSSGESDSVDVSTGGGGGGSYVPPSTTTPSPTPTPTATPTPTPTATPTPTPTATSTDTPTPMPTESGTQTLQETTTTTATSERSESDGTVTRSPPTGGSAPDERVVPATELSAVEIVEVELVTAPANSVNATSIVTLRNLAEDERTTDVRFVHNGEVLTEREVTIAGDEQRTVAHNEIVEEPGSHEFTANVATGTESSGMVRTYDFEIGLLEMDDTGEEVDSSSADAPAPGTATGAIDDDRFADNGSILPLVVGFVAVLVLIIGGLYWRRHSDDSAPTPVDESA
jgi:hypothetical protein